MKIARLNKQGIEHFANWIDNLKVNPSTPSPLFLLTDINYSEPIEKEITVEVKQFANRFETAKYLFDTFGSADLTDIDNDSGLWAWLSLFYIDEVCPVNNDGNRKPREIARYILDPVNYQRYYRHLLAGPYRIYRTYRDDPKIALALLCQPLAKFGDIVEQLASRQELVTNKGIIALATRLYVCPQTGQLKRGAGGKSAGSARRLSDVIDQFDLTWDLYASSVDDLQRILPKEFANFLR
jgi:hypothetical protein